jgi:predicted DCC family thiol-disulfide oxidoreductase YuxK
VSRARGPCARYDDRVDSLVLFDGKCNLCNGSVQFIIDHERAPTLRFAPLQSDIASERLKATLGEEATRALVLGAAGSGDPESIVIIEDGKAYTHSTAALRLASHLTAPWRWAFVFYVVPRFIRDLVYRWIARNRYRWFGKTESCRVPTPELRARFIGDAR